MTLKDALTMKMGGYKVITQAKKDACGLRRVPGGWIYEIWVCNKGNDMTPALCCFIPLSEAMKEVDYEE